MHSIEFLTSHLPVANEEDFDNKESRFAKAVEHFGLVARSRFTFVSLTCKRPKCSTAPYLNVSSMGGGGILEVTPIGYFKYAPAIFVVKNVAARRCLAETAIAQRNDGRRVRSPPSPGHLACRRKQLAVGAEQMSKRCQIGKKQINSRDKCWPSEFI